MKVIGIAGDTRPEGRLVGFRHVASGRGELPASVDAVDGVECVRVVEMAC